MPATDDSDDSDDGIDHEPTDEDTAGGPTSPAAVPDLEGGDVDYDRLLAEFGADPVTADQVGAFPDPPPLVRRGVFYAERDLDRFMAAADAGDRHSIVTGVGPSGPMHVGHVFPLYFAKHLQETTGAHVYVPLSDDEKFFLRDQTLAEGSAYLRENLRDLLAVGFDPGRTRFVLDTADADLVYPAATALAERVTPATVEATYGERPNVGAAFYPAVQALHLLLPQLVDGQHPTLVPIAVDQDPHVRVCRDVAAKEAFDVEKPGALLSKFLPSLEGPGKMSSSDDAPAIELDDDRETVREKVLTHAYSGGRSDVEAHREHGGDPAVDVAYQYLAAFFEDDDERLADLAAQYRAGDLLSGELKEYAAERIADFLAAHQRRKADLGPLEEELPAYRLSEDERARALRRVGYPDDAHAVTGRGR